MIKEGVASGKVVKVISAIECYWKLIIIMCLILVLYVTFVSRGNI